MNNNRQNVFLWRALSETRYSLTSVNVIYVAVFAIVAVFVFRDMNAFSSRVDLMDFILLSAVGALRLHVHLISKQLRTVEDILAQMREDNVIKTSTNLAGVQNDNA